MEQRIEFKLRESSPPRLVLQAYLTIPAGFNVIAEPDRNGPYVLVV
jgi:hypothetical protein